MNIAVGIDDTICEFIKPLLTYYGIRVPFEDHTDDNFSKLWKTDHHLLISQFVDDTCCMDLPPIDGALQQLQLLKDTGMFKFHIVSARHSRLIEKTTEWLNTHFPGIFSTVNLCNTYGTGPRRTKLEVCEQLDVKIIIEDTPLNVVSDKIRVITHSRPWNRNGCEWSQMISQIIQIPPVRIGVSGKIGSGKDTVAEIILVLFNIHRRAFATRVKMTVAGMTGTTLEMNESREHKSYKPPGCSKTLGQLQQIIGSSMREKVDEDIWVNLLLDDPSLPSRVVISDTRFPNEANRLDLVIRLEGDPVKIRELNLDNRDLNHPSETALDDYPFKYVIDNNRDFHHLTVELLRVLVKEFM